MATNIYSHIDRNKRETVFIFIGFTLLISFMAWFIGQYFLDGAGVGMVGLALIFSGFSSLISYYNSDKIVLRLSKARELDPDENPDLENLVENMCIASGLPMPRIYLIDDTAMNAFATGRNPEHAVICFTTGIVARLEKRELEAVVAHELSHIQNYDILVMSITTILVGTVTLLADWFTRGVFYGSGSRKKDIGGLGLIIGIVLTIISPIIATLIKLAISRNREFLADSSAALLTRYPEGLARALEKISSDTEILEAANGATAHMYIANPLKSQKAVSFMANLFNTHPPVEERIKRLRSM